MPNYAETKLYELISHDENGEPVVYRGHTTQPLRNRKSEHISKYRAWLKDNTKEYCTSYEVLKHGKPRIELVRMICCNNVMEANREEGKFIRELPTCVNILKNKYENKAEYYQANKETRKAKDKEYYQANKDTINARVKEYRKANKDTINAKLREYHHANRDTILVQKKERYQANKETILEQKKEYYQANKETIKAKKKTRQSEKITCECGAVVCRGSMLYHCNTWTHIRDFIHC